MALETLSPDQVAMVDVVAGTLVNPPAVAGAAELRSARAAVYAAYCYAPEAPEDVLLEAAVRIAGWLKEARPAFARWRLAGADSTSIERDRAGANALRNSGAAPLLAPYRELRAFEGF